MRLGKAGFLYLVGQALISLSGFLATFAIAVLAGSDALGQYAVAVAMASFLLIIPAQAISQAVTKRMSEGEEAGSYFTFGIVANGGYAIVLVVVVLLLGTLIQYAPVPQSGFTEVFVRYNYEIALLSATTVAFWIVRSAIEGDKQVGHSGLLQGLERLGRTAVQVALLLAGFHVGGLIFGHAVTILVGAIGGFFLVNSTLERPTKAHASSVLEYARYAWLGTLRTRIFGWFDTVVLSFFVSTSLVGIYEAAWGIAALLGIVSLAIRRTLFPEVSDLSAREDFERVRSILADAVAFSGIVVIPGLFGAAVIGHRILRFYRPEFGEGATILLVLILAYAAEAYGSQFVSVVNAIDRPSLAYRVNKFFVLLSVLLTISLAWAFGWHGAAVATATASIFRAWFGYRVLQSELDGVPIPLDQIGYQVLAAVAMALVVGILAEAIPQGRIGTLILVFTGALVYFLVLLLVSESIRQKALSVAGIESLNAPSR